MEQIGRYQILGELGRGAMGVVYRAMDPSIGREVAIKTIRLTEFSNPDQRGKQRERLFREARSAGILSHPGIVTIYDMAEQGDMAYIAMEFVTGSSLEQLLALKDPLDSERIFGILRQTAAALDYAQANIRVNAVCPGIIDTRMMDRVTGDTPEGRQRVISQEPIGRMGKPEEISAAVLWLCSEAASFVVGHAMVVDGGQTV